MFEQYSVRAKRTVFLARLIAGKRGAAEIDVEHLAEAIILEDLGEFASLLGVERGRLAAVVHKPIPSFLSPEAASGILLKLRQEVPNAKPIADSTDMPVSSVLGRVFAAATSLASEINQKQVEPLHLLAAVLGEDSSDTSVAFQEAGINRESVLIRIKNGKQT